MTLSAHIQSSLSSLYLGKTIKGPDYDPTPFTVRLVDVSDDWGATEVWFWSHERWDPAPPANDMRGFGVRQYADLPTILS